MVRLMCLFKVLLLPLPAKMRSQFLDKKKSSRHKKTIAMLTKHLTNVKNPLILLLIMLVLTQACECGKGKDIPNVSGVEADVELKRFEKDLFNADTLNFEAALQALEQEYPEFSDIFFNQIMGANDPRIAPEGAIKYIKGFVTDQRVRQLYDTVQIVFPDLQWFEKDLEQAIRFYRYYFPRQAPPQKVVTYLSEYTIAGFLYGDNNLAIGLDFFLGEDYPYLLYNPGNPNFSNYLTRTYNKDHLVMRCVKLLVQDLLGQTNGSRMIDHMIHSGKELYLMDCLLPFAPDTVVFEFSKKQLEWCKNNEANMWAYFLTENLLYSTDWGSFRKYVEYSPNSPGMPDEAPGRTGSYLGFKIVEAYMKRHPETTLEQLVQLNDAQAILEKAKFKPAR